MKTKRGAWRPIATAPKDGTDILLTDGRHVTVGHWLHEAGGTIEYRGLDGSWIGQDDIDIHEDFIDWMGGINPILWKPLPPAPRKSYRERKCHTK